MTAVKTPDKIGAVPNQPRTKAYAFRLPRHYMDAIDAEVERRGTDRTEVVRRAIREHFALPEDVDEDVND